MHHVFVLLTFQHFVYQRNLSYQHCHLRRRRLHDLVCPASSRLQGRRGFSSGDNPQGSCLDSTWRFFAAKPLLH